MLPSNASSLEVIWTFIAVLGAGVATSLLAYIWLSYRAVVAWIGTGRVLRWGPRHTFVFGFLVGIALLLLVWLGFVSLGINAIINPPPISPARAAASERGGWILVTLESLLFIFQVVLTGAWVAVGRPTLHPGQEPLTLPAMLLQATGAGREMGHLIKNRLAASVGFIDMTLESAVLTTQQRRDLIDARDNLLDLAEDAATLHDRIRRLEPKP